MAFPTLRLVAMLAVLAAVAVAPAPARAGGSSAPRTSPPCPESDVWIVSTRRLPGTCGPVADAAFDVQRRIEGRWHAADLADLCDDPARPLAVFIHGNRYEAGEAAAQGVTVARRLDAAASRPVRTVAFSWPSQQRGRLVESSRMNYRRASADGHYLAAMLGRLPAEQPVALIGYSLGALVAVEALDDLASGESGPLWTSRAGRTHLVLVAPAIRCDALAPRGSYAAAASAVQRLTLVINSRDIALRMFPHLDRETDSPALGVAGMSRRWVPAGVEYSASDAAPVVGIRHAFPEYLQSAALMQRIAGGAVAGLVAD